LIKVARGYRALPGKSAVDRAAEFLRGRGTDGGIELTWLLIEVVVELLF
jgi:hypothetical protein